MAKTNSVTRVKISPLHVLANLGYVKFLNNETLHMLSCQMWKLCLTFQVVKICIYARQWEGEYSTVQKGVVQTETKKKRNSDNEGPVLRHTYWMCLQFTITCCPQHKGCLSMRLLSLAPNISIRNTLMNELKNSMFATHLTIYSLQKISFYSLVCGLEMLQSDVQRQVPINRFLLGQRCQFQF